MRASRGSQLALLVVGVVFVVATALLPFNSPLAPHPSTTPLGQAVDSAVKLLWLAAILVARWRRPASPVWILMLAYLLASRIWTLGHLPASLFYSLQLVFARIDLAVYGHVLVAFPTGRPRTAFDRRLIAGLYLAVIVPGILAALFTQPAWGAADCRDWCPRNLFAIGSDSVVVDNVVRLAGVLTPILGALVVLSVWRHWRASGPAERRVLVPVAAAVPIAWLVTSVAYTLNPLLGINALAALGPIPDALLGIVPVGLLLGVLRVQLDRARIAGLAVELGRGPSPGGMRDALARALGDPTLELAFAGTTAGEYLDPSGRRVELPEADPLRAVARLERDGELLALMVHDRGVDDEDPGLVEAVEAMASQALVTGRLAAQVREQRDELRASRLRTVEAADAERRRVERDLHDGAQQRLVALAMRLQVAREGAGDVSALIDATASELDAAISEVRELGRGMRPALLDEAGLEAALESLAERSAVPVRIIAPGDRYPSAVESAAYFVVAEALTNVARHAAATGAVVEVTRERDRLTVSVADDGRGGADVNTGSGIRGLADRVGALGGRLTVSSPVDGGTTIRAELPLG